MRRRPSGREVQFEVADGRLVRTVRFPDGGGYVHRCTQAIYEAVAHAAEETSDSGATLDVLAEKLDAPFTQVAVALDFLKEQGCVVTRLRLNYPA